MEFRDWSTVAIVAILSFVFCQLLASGHIGNIPFSIWYESHFLVKKKGLCKLVYFKPKHFGRYTLFEACCFFFSFLQIPALLCVAILTHFNFIPETAFLVITMAIPSFPFASAAVIGVINDIGFNKERKVKFYFEDEGKERDIQPRPDLENIKIPPKDRLIKKLINDYSFYTNNDYFTTYSLRLSYDQRVWQQHGHYAGIEDVNKQYIEYFRNLKKLVIVKENKDGSLQLKIKK